MTTRISILGEVTASSDEGPLEVGPQQQRALLALLATSGRPVAVERIVDALWPDDPPASAAKVVQTYVSRLRKVLGQDAIETRASGYALALPPEAVDLHSFERLAQEGHPVEALALWRGPALADVSDLPALALEAERLESQRLAVLEQRIDLDLTAGTSPALIGELQTLVAHHPLRERFVGQLMLALYRTGRQTEALDVYTATRQRLAVELGLEPGPQLKELQQQILAHDERLTQRDSGDASRAPGPDATRRRRRLVLPVAGALALLAVAASSWALFLRDDEPAVVLTSPNRIAAIDPETSTVVDSIPVGRDPGSITATADYVWVVNDTDGTLSRVDIGDDSVETIGRLPQVGIVTTDERGFAYVSGFDDALVSQVDPESLRIVRRLRVESRATGLAVGGGSLWVVDRLVGRVKQVDLASGRIANTIPVGNDPIFAAFGYGALWVVNSDDGTVSVVRPGSSDTRTIEVTYRALGVATGEGGVWVADHGSPAVTRIDPDTQKSVDVIEGPVGGSYLGVAAGGGGVWLTNPDNHEIVRIDPHTNRITDTIQVDGWPRGIATAGDRVWVSISGPDPP